MGDLFAFKPRSKLNRYVMHTDDGEVRKANAKKWDPERHGFVPAHTHSNGVKEHIEPEYGSSLYVYHAPNLKEARTKINEADENSSKRDEAAFDRTMGSSQELFRKNKAEIKPFKKPD